MMQHKVAQIIGRGLVVLLVWQLTACGFHLRGTQSGAIAIEQLVLVADNADPVLMQELRAALSLAGVQMMAADDKDVVRISVHHSTRGRQVSSVGISGSAQDYRLDYQVNFTITLPGLTATALPEEIQRTVRFSRDISFNIDEVLAKGVEYDQAYAEMSRQAAAAILRQLRLALRQQAVTTPH